MGPAVRKNMSFEWRNVSERWGPNWVCVLKRNPRTQKCSQLLLELAVQGQWQQPDLSLQTSVVHNFFFLENKDKAKSKMRWHQQNFPETKVAITEEESVKLTLYVNCIKAEFFEQMSFRNWGGKFYTYQRASQSFPWS